MQLHEEVKNMELLSEEELNKILSTKQELLIAVCCAAKIPERILNDFLLHNYQKANMDPTYPLLVIVDDLDETYTTADDLPVAFEGDGRSAAPFQNLTPAQCEATIRRMNIETETDLSYRFVIVDERLGLDDVVTVVCNGVAFQAAGKLALWLIMLDIDQGMIQSYVHTVEQTVDGVYRLDV